MKIKTVTLNEVDFNELNRAVSAHFGQCYEVVSDEELSNDSSKEVTVERKPLNEWEAQRVEKFRTTGKGQYLLHRLLQQMCNEGKIEPGKYLVKISW